jgi:hypothetical protein
MKVSELVTQARRSQKETGKNFLRRQRDKPRRQKKNAQHQKPKKNTTFRPSPTHKDVVMNF